MPQPPASSATAYAAAGVDVDANDRLIPRYRQLAQRAARPEQLGAVGAFSGLFDLSQLKQYRNPVLAASTDGVGTKVIIAALAGRLEGVGPDIVNHSINDLLCSGAAPLCFLDYLAGHELAEDAKAAIVESIADACRAGGLALLGGETADMSDLYPAGHFDLAGTIIGVLEKGSEITGEHIAAGDAVIGLPSSGLHTNGYSLARAVFQLREADVEGGADDRRARLLAPEPQLGESLADALLRPHRSYGTALRDALPYCKGISHTTGGGISGNLERILPTGLQAELDLRRWPVPPIFPLIQQCGEIAPAEMYRVFNMGLGMAVVVDAADTERVLQLIAASGDECAADAAVIGAIRPAPAEEPAAAARVLVQVESGVPGAD